MTPKRIIAMLACAAVAAAAFRVAFFVVSVRHVPPVMDECISLLQAKCIVESKDSAAAQAKLYPRPLLGRFPLLFMTQPYLFPLESYFNAPFVRWLPRNAVGARAVPLVLGILSLVCCLLILRRWRGLADVWPGVVLLLFPSTYWLMLQSAYSPPGYASFLFLSALVVLLAQIYRDSGRSHALLAFAAGLCGGIACSAQLLAIPVLLGAGAVVLLAHRWRTRLAAVPLFAAGAWLGLLPFLAAKWFYPGAQEVVSARRPLAEALHWLWTPTLNFTLPSAMGIRCPRFPDGVTSITLLSGLDTAFPVLWAALLVAATLVAAWRLAVRTAADRRLSLKTSDLFIGIAWLSLWMFIVNKRSESHSFRYLLPLVWTFPFLVAYLYLNARRAGRIVLGALAVLLAAFNAATAVAVMKQWSAAGFALEEARIADLGPAVRYLGERGITRCYSCYFNTYRLNFMTDERVICSQHYNDRFYGWPLPYKDAVDAATNVAFVLGPTYRFRADELEDDLKAMAVAYRREAYGDMQVYTDFRWAPPRPEKLVSRDNLQVATDVYRQDERLLVDGMYETRWRSHGAQTQGMGIELRLKQPVPICRVSLYYNLYPYDRARALKIMARQGDAWQTVLARVPENFERFEFINGHPVYGNQVQTIRFEPVVTQALRIEIAEPSPGRDWTVGEITVYESPVGSPSPNSGTHLRQEASARQGADATG